MQQQALQPLAAVVARGVSQQFASSSASNAADHQSTQLLQDSHATSSSDSSNGSSSQAVSRSQTQRLLGSNVPGQTPHLNLLQLSHHRQQQHLQQQQYQQWRCLTDVAPHSQQADESSATGQQILASQRLQQQMQQQQRPQQQQKQRLGQAPGVRSELETALLQAHNVEALAAVVRVFACPKDNPPTHWLIDCACSGLDVLPTNPNTQPLPPHHTHNPVVTG